jgi:4-hydroxybenzoate polyprenyltransferase
MLKNLVLLMRPKHYLKNGLILVPLIFSGGLFADANIVKALIAILIFSLAASVVYIVNDARDIAKDRKHPTKKNRPLASGAVKTWQAYVLLAGLVFAIGVTAAALDFSWMTILLLVIYLLINFAYSFGLKNIPVVDVAILASGFVIRVLFGASIFDIEVSNWLYLTVLAGAFYASLGKRRNEIIVNGTKSRKVNEAYTLNFLDKNMYVSLALVLVFYSLWAIDPSGGGDRSLFWTIPVVIMLFMTYSLNIEKQDSLGDPVDVILGDKMLIVLGLIYVVLATSLLYL